MSSYMQLQRDVVGLAKVYVTDERVFQIMRERQIADLQSPEAKAAVFNQLVDEIMQVVKNHLNSLQNLPSSQRGIAPRSFTTLYWDVISSKLNDLNSRVFSLSATLNS